MRLGVFVGALALGACANVAETNLDVPSPSNAIWPASLCDNLASFARSVQRGETKTIRLSQKGQGWADSAKFCGWPEGDTVTEAVCSWWVRNSASEFFHANVNALNECLSVDPPMISSPGGAPDAEHATGSFHFKAIRDWPGDAEAEVEYFIPWSLPDGSLHRFVELRASRPAGEDTPFSR